MAARAYKRPFVAPSILTGWPQFVKGFGIDLQRDRHMKRKLFFDVMRFRQQKLGIG